MANEIRLRRNNISGTITDNPLTIGATTINSAGFADLPVVDGTNHLLLILDPTEVGGTAEIVRVTAHTAAATSVTVARGVEGSTARSHVFNTTWFHGPAASDYIGVLGYAQVTANQTLTANTDLTGLSVTVTVGNNRRIRVTGKVSWNNENAGANYGTLAIMESGTELNANYIGLLGNGSIGEEGSVITQSILTPSAGAHTYNLRGLGTVFNLIMTASATRPAFILVEDLGPVLVEGTG